MAQDFEGYLNERFWKEYPDCLDDAGEEAFNAWISELTIDELIRYADWYVKAELSPKEERELKMQSLLRHAFKCLYKLKGCSCASNIKEFLTHDKTSLDFRRRNEQNNIYNNRSK